jgi:hypothetical protein
VVFEKEMGVMHAIIEKIFDINGIQWREHKRQETEGFFPKSMSWQMGILRRKKAEPSGGSVPLNAGSVCT